MSESTSDIEDGEAAEAWIGLWRESSDRGQVIGVVREVTAVKLQSALIKVIDRTVASEFRLRIEQKGETRILHVRAHDLKRWDPSTGNLPGEYLASPWSRAIARSKARRRFTAALEAAFSEAIKAQICSRKAALKAQVCCAALLQN